jgi:hypothetical protein
MTTPFPVDPSAIVLRIDLRWYGWEPETWEKLVDPYARYPLDASNVEKIWPAGKPWIDGKTYKEPFKYVDKRTAAQQAIAPHLALAPSSPDKIKDVVAWTRSSAPMVRADWFHVQTATQEGKVPGYYDFRGIKDEATYFASVRFDRKLADQTEHVRAALFSGITHQPRRVSRTNGVLGAMHESFDSEAAIGRKNPYVVLDETLEFDITEKYAPGLNGWPVWYLGDSKGKRADKALDNIVGGDLFGIQYAPAGSKPHDTRLQINLSCVSCHFSQLHENGVKFANASHIKKLGDPDPDVYERLARQYLRDLKTPVAQDRLGYLTVVKETTGWEPAEYAVEYRTAHSLYEFGRIGLVQAAREMGVPVDRLRIAFTAYAAATGDRLDPILSTLRDNGEVPRRQWEYAFPEAWRVYSSVEIVPPKKER